MKKRWMLIVFAGLLGCASVLPRGSALDLSRAKARYPQASLESLEAGRHAYALRCSGCHALHLPSEKRADEWPARVAEMERDAHLAPGERELIVQYLVTFARP